MPVRAGKRSVPRGDQAPRQLQSGPHRSIAPEQDVPWEGVRATAAGFSLPGFTLEEEANCLTISTDTLRVIVRQPLALEWQYRDAAGHWQLLTGDRPTSAYQINAHGDGVAHYQRRMADDRYGLGENRRSATQRQTL